MTPYDDPAFDQLLSDAQSAAGGLDASVAGDVQNVLANEQALLRSKQDDMRLLNDMTVKATEYSMDAAEKGEAAPKRGKRAQGPGGMDPARFNSLVAAQRGQELAMEAGVSRMMESFQQSMGQRHSMDMLVALRLDDMTRRLREVEQILQRSRD